jgi:hypothetical protein
MKKIIFPLFAALSLMFTACEKDGSELPSISFETAIPMTIDGASVVTVSVKGYTGTEPVTIPVKFDGTAEKGVDYEVSAEAFVIGGTEPVTSIKVTPIDYNSDKKVTMSIEIPNGFTAGQYTSTSFSLSGKIGKVTFATKTGTMTAKATLTVEVYNNDGQLLRLQDGDEIAVEVDREKSTAIEGTHFTFKDGKKAAVIEAGKNSGTIVLEFKELAEDQNKVVLKLKPTGKFGIGAYESIEITIVGSQWEKINGKWIIDELVTDKQKMYDDNYLEYSDAGWDNLTNYPEFNDGDSFTVDLENGKFIPEFKSAFKNFFVGESGIVALDELFIRTGMGGAGFTVQQFELDNTNRYFTEKDPSEDKVSIIGVQLATDEKTSEDILCLYIIDYYSKTFMTNAWYVGTEYDMYNPEKPSATSTGMFIQINFKKAK